MLAYVPKDDAVAIAEMFEDAAELCIRVEAPDQDHRTTRIDYRGMTPAQAWGICHEIALACSLSRMGYRDPREEVDTLGLDVESKVCVAFRESTQQFTWKRSKITYMDAAIACRMSAMKLWEEELNDQGNQHLGSER